jgi:hypothetical protein
MIRETEAVTVTSSEPSPMLTSRGWLRGFRTNGGPRRTGPTRRCKPDLQPARPESHHGPSETPGAGRMTGFRNALDDRSTGVSLDRATVVVVHSQFK